jgi:hypothetical protein
MPTPIIGRRSSAGANEFSTNYQVVIAEKQKLVTPSGKKEKLIVFSRVPQSQIHEDTSGKTARAAKRAVTIIRERLEKSGSPKATIDKIMRSMYAVDQRAVAAGDMKSMKTALDAQALDALIEKKKMGTGKVRFAEESQTITVPDTPNSAVESVLKDIALPRAP